jgi:uncharacterized damage-inducible protein DinB
MLSKEIASQFRAAHLEGRWIASNLKEKLEDITLSEAKTKIGTVNTIQALTYHINYYIAGLNEVFKGKPLIIRDKYSFDVPSMVTEEEWQTFLKKVFADAEEFAAHVEALTDEQLHGPFSDPKYGSMYKNIHAMIQHVYYHSGQIAVLKKMVREGK